MSKSDKAAAKAVMAYSVEFEFRNGRRPRLTVSMSPALSGRVLVHDCDRPFATSFEFDSKDAAQSACYRAYCR